MTSQVSVCAWCEWDRKRGCIFQQRRWKLLKDLCCCHTISKHYTHKHIMIYRWIDLLTKMKKVCGNVLNVPHNAQCMYYNLSYRWAVVYQYCLLNGLQNDILTFVLTLMCIVSDTYAHKDVIKYGSSASIHAFWWVGVCVCEWLWCGGCRAAFNLIIS